MAEATKSDLKRCEEYLRHCTSGGPVIDEHGCPVGAPKPPSGYQPARDPHGFRREQAHNVVPHDDIY